jgi:hypothetical protein
MKKGGTSIAASSPAKGPINRLLSAPLTGHRREATFMFILAVFETDSLTLARDLIV